MKKSFKHLFLFINKSLHRFLLWMKPAYIRHRTPEQKRFDLKIQYTFLGCLIGMLAVALLLYYKTHHQTEQLAEISQQEIAMEETITSQETEKEGTESLDETEPLQISITQEEITTTEMTLNQNETLSGLLKRAGVPLSQALKVANSLDIVCDIKRFRPGQSFEIIFIGNNFQGLKLEDRKGQTISVLKNSNGEFIPQSKEGIIETNRFV